MEHYRVFLRGENFILEVDGEAACLGSACLGFYTTRFVQAEGREAAEILAVDLIRGDRTLAGVKNTRDNPPMDLRGRDRRNCWERGTVQFGLLIFQMDEEADDAGDA